MKKLQLINFVPIVELISKLFAFLVVILLSHLLSLKDNGLYAMIVTSSMIISVFMDGGINNKIYNSLLQNLTTNLSQYYSLRILLSCLSIMVASVYAYFVLEYWFEFTLYLLMAFFISQIILYKLIYRAYERVEWDIICTLIDPLIKGIILAILFFFFKDTIDLKLVLIVFLFGAFLQYYAIRKQFSIQLKTINFSLIAFNMYECLKDIQHYVLYYLLYILFQRIDIFFIKKYLSIENVAIYFSAYNIYTALVIVLIAIVNSTFPKIKHLPMNHQLLYLKNYFLIYFCMLLMSYFSLPFIYTIIYPPEYIAGADILHWLLLAMPFVFVSYLAIFNLNYQRLESKNTLSILLALIVKFFIFAVYSSLFSNLIIFVKFYILYEAMLMVILLFVVIKYVRIRQ